MTSKLKFLERTFSAVFASVLLAGLVFTMSCDNSNDTPPAPELYPLTAVYTFDEAILQTTFEIPGIGIPITAPRDITNEMAGGLLANANCVDPSNGAVELKSDNKLFFTCLTEGTETQAGTWAVNGDTTKLTLSLSVPAPLSLAIEDFTINESTDVIGGTIKNFPITKELLAGFLVGVPGADAILAGLADTYVQLVDVDIKFKKE
jgi:hypothetical protein